MAPRPRIRLLLSNSISRARIPQIIKNCQERSCEGTIRISKAWEAPIADLAGLALLFFMLSLLGNASYGAQVRLMCKPVYSSPADTSQIIFHSRDKQYLSTNTPWLIGSLGRLNHETKVMSANASTGTMVEDIIIFIQFHLYNGQSRGASSTAIE